MTEGDLMKIIQQMGFCYCKQGEVLFKKGDEANYFYVLLGGKVDQFVTNPTFKKLKTEIDEVKNLIDINKNELTSQRQ